MTDFKKGDVVEIRALVDNHTSTSKALPKRYEWKRTVYADVPERNSHALAPRRLKRFEFPEPIKGIVVGWSTRHTGWRVAGHWETPATFDRHESFRVIMVQPLHDERWLRPYPCLEADLSLVEPSHD